jgi:NitT/TauT family transport system permease protein
VSLGSLLENGRDFGDVAQMFSVMLVLIIIGIAIDSLIFSPLERTVRSRWGFQR